MNTPGPRSKPPCWHLAWQPLPDHPRRPTVYPTRPVMLLSPTGAGSGPDVIARIVADRLTQDLGTTGAGRQSARWRWRHRRAGRCRGTIGRTYALYAARIDLRGAAGDAGKNAARSRTRSRADRDGRRAADGHHGESGTGHQHAGGTNCAGERPPGRDIVRGRPRDAAASDSRNAAQAGRSRPDLYSLTSARAMQDAIGGTTHVFIGDMAALSGPMQGGSLKALAVASSSRLPDFPDLPTVEEAAPGIGRVRSAGMVCLDGARPNAGRHRAKGQSRPAQRSSASQR